VAVGDGGAVSDDYFSWPALRRRTLWRLKVLIVVTAAFGVGYALLYAVAGTIR
jgi:hypothetical protein